MWLRVCFLSHKPWVPMEDVGGSPLECIWCNFLLIELSFKAFPVLASLWVEHRTWFVSGRTHPLEKSHSEQPRRANRLFQSTLGEFVDGFMFCSLLVSWLWAGVGAGWRWWELFLLAGDEGVDIKERSQKPLKPLLEILLLEFLLRKWGWH